MNQWKDTIAAIATAPGIGAIGVVRLSGPEAIPIANRIFKGKDLSAEKPNTLHFGKILNAGGEFIDEVVVSLFKGPRSYTGEDVVEISGHGSPYVLQTLLQTCLEAGARLAQAGEYTQRAFLNGKMDLTQAEAVADLIAADSRAAHQTALQHLRGGFSGDLAQLREELIHFAALIELELDFAEEDVEFANRDTFQELIVKLQTATRQLLDSFQLGNAIKKGVSVAIIGKPNAGKSTLLNALLNEERAIVSPIAGTTRDTIEEALNIDGLLFRLIDTAGIRESSDDQIEQIGIERSRENARKADIILHLKDATEPEEDGDEWLQEFRGKVIEVINKIDLNAGASTTNPSREVLTISAKEKTGIDTLIRRMFDKATGGSLETENTIVTNARHQQALVRITESLEAIFSGLTSGLSGDLLALDIRRALHYLGEITGQVEIDRDILGTIFGKFCIGK